MKAADLRTKDQQQLQQELLRLLREQLDLRFQKASGQLGQTHLLRQARRDIARVRTLLRQAQTDAMQHTETGS